jgi:signal transduction histidine kinase
LEGFEETWNETDATRRHTTYTNLDPGGYVFRVTGSNNHGVWNEDGAAIRITVTPPWWQTLWFRTLLAGSFVGVAFMLHELRMKYVVQKNQRLEEEIAKRNGAETELKDLGRRMISAQEDDRAAIARELHDDVGQRLAAAMIGIDISRRSLTSAPERADKQLGDLREQLDQVSEGIRQVSRELHPSTLEHLGIETALEVLCEEFESQDGFRMRVSLPESVERLSPEAELCLYRVAQETLRNVTRHAQASEVELELSVAHGNARLRVADNGIGFDTQSRKAGLGLASIRERARLLDGDVQFRSAPGAGTEVIVEIPLGEEGS